MHGAAFALVPAEQPLAMQQDTADIDAFHAQALTSAHTAARRSGPVSTERRLMCRAHASSAGNPSASVSDVALLHTAVWRLNNSILAGVGTRLSTPSNAVSM
ncbi:hypothetical protein [Streptomyces sp. NPDC093260]|uniref:hypothetical protein n=1 Tax=Streptomyces sp. NPDC093260 TaxID=3155073 RepID=UPI003449635B